MLVLDEKENILKNPLTILRSGAVFLALQKLWVNNHLNVKDPEKLVADFFEFLRASATETLNVSKGHLMSKPEVNPRKIRDFYGQLLKEHKTEDINPDFKKDMLFHLIEKDLSQVKTVLDFGCGKLAFLKNIAAQNKSIKKLIGVDSKSRPILADLDLRISFESDLNNIAAESVDLAIIKLVLHHIESDAEIVEILQKIKKVLRPNGKLIIFEESFPDTQKGHQMSDRQGEQVTVDVQMAKEYLSQFCLELAEEATADFLELTKEEKMQFLFLNDWLMNMQNKYMPWTWQYKSAEDWAMLAESAGFESLESHFIGAIEKRKRKQGMTAIMIFKK